jgi:hypothetical protein
MWAFCRVVSYRDSILHAGLLAGPNGACNPFLAATPESVGPGYPDPVQKAAPFPRAAFTRLDAQRRRQRIAPSQLQEAR